LQASKESQPSSNFHPSPDFLLIMKVCMSVLLLLGSIFAIAAAGPISENSLKNMISEVLSQEVHDVYSILQSMARILQVHYKHDYEGIVQLLMCFSIVTAND
jgi:hypothetical protein